MKRTILFALCAALILTAAGCAGSGTGSVSSDGSQAVSAASSREEPSSREEEYKPLADKVSFRPADANKQVRRLKILPVGDSLCRGDGTLSGWRYQTFRALYAAGVTFEFVGPFTGGNRETRMPERYVRHAGTGGWKVEDVLTNKERIFDREFDAVFLMLGFNDGPYSSGTLVQSNYRAILDYIFERNPDAAVFCMGVAPSRYNVTTGTTTHGAFNQKIKGFCEELAAQGKTIVYVNTWSSTEWDHDTCFGDNVHFNEKGNAIVADLLVSKAAPVLLERNVADSACVLPASPGSITLDKSVLSLVAHATYGEGAQLTATVSPSDAEITSVVWGSSDRNVATVDEAGTVRGVGAGTCTVTAYTLDGGLSAACTVTVTEDKRDVLAFTSDMKDAAEWSGADPEQFKLGKYYFGAREGGSLTSAQTVEATDRFRLSASVRSYAYNIPEREKTGVLSFSLGGLTLRVQGLDYACSVLLDGREICRYERGRYGIDRIEYGVIYDRGAVTLTRNGVPVATGKTESRSFSGPVEIEDRIPNQTMIRFVNVAAW